MTSFNFSSTSWEFQISQCRVVRLFFVISTISHAELISHEYVLEVSSPGVERPLTRPAHFQRAIGQRVRVRLFRPLFTPPRKSLTGVLVAFENECVEVEVEGAGRFVIERKDIAKANLQPEWD